MKEFISVSEVISCDRAIPGWRNSVKETVLKLVGVTIAAVFDLVSLRL